MADKHKTMLWLVSRWQWWAVWRWRCSKTLCNCKFLDSLLLRWHWQSWRRMPYALGTVTLNHDQVQLMNCQAKCVKLYSINSYKGPIIFYECRLARKYRIMGMPSCQCMVAISHYAYLYTVPLCSNYCCRMYFSLCNVTLSTMHIL